MGNGAIILTFPDEPINLANNLQVTWGTRIGLTWDEGNQNGGTPVLDYTVLVSSVESGNLYIEKQVNSVGTAVTLLGHNLGVVYTYKVKSRNAFDFSVGYSNEVSILAATNPSQPDAPTTTVDGDYVRIDWSAPSENGSPITGYKVYIRQLDMIYTMDLVNCDGSTDSIRLS